MNINLEKIEIKKILFENDLIEGKNSNLAVGREFTFNIGPDKKKGIGKLEIKISPNTKEPTESELRAYIIAQGFFSTDEDIENPEIVAKDIHSKMYAYVQATMKAMCGLAGMPSLFIPELPLEKPRTNAEEK